jgi:hypothetical protein
MEKHVLKEQGRIRVRFKPLWQGSIEGWTVKYIAQNMWRLEPDHEFEDIVQECNVMFYKCRKTYPGVVDPPHFMSLYQRCVINMVTDLAHKRTRNSHIHGTHGEHDLFENLKDPVAGINALMAQLMRTDIPEPVAKLLEALQAYDKLPRLRRDRYGKRETTSAYLCRIAKISFDPQFAARLRGWITGDTPCTGFTNQ